MTDWVYNDGGRAAAGFKGSTRDCVTRAIAIAAQIPYSEVYQMVNEAAQSERPRIGGRSSARTGVYKNTVRHVIEGILGWAWTPTMSIGSGCRVHLTRQELPSGRIIASCSKHLVAVIDGTIHDVCDPSRNGTRCVYGYWRSISNES